jgi:hypothetical protein
VNDLYSVTNTEYEVETIMNTLTLHLLILSTETTEELDGGFDGIAGKETGSRKPKQVGQYQEDSCY